MNTKHRWHLLTALISILFYGCFGFFGCLEKSSNPFENEIHAYEQSDIESSPGTGMVLFVGSSSIRMWDNLDKDFPDGKVLNRGFGGSETSDVINFFNRIVRIYEPSKIVFYEGDNDIANGKSAEQVASDFKDFLELVEKDLPGVPVGFISIKPSPSRWDLHGEMETANSMIKSMAKERGNLEYIDVYNPMLGENGHPKPEIFLTDSLHMNEKGYEIWKQAVAPFLTK